MAQVDNASKLDINAAKSNQTVIILLLLASFLLKVPGLALFVGAVMALGAFLGFPGFHPVYKYLLRPLNIVKPNLADADPQARRFAQGVGAACSLTGAILLYAGYEYAGWGFVWMVILLAGVNLFSGYCVGCHLYHWMKLIKGKAHLKSSG